MASFGNLSRAGIREQVKLVSISINNFRSVLQIIFKVKPDEIYNLAGQSLVGLSFEQPVETMERISVGRLNLLEAIRFSNILIRFYSAGSSECFGGTSRLAADGTTLFRPRSPYELAEATVFWQVANYRKAHQLNASTRILFNHESLHYYGRSDSLNRRSLRLHADANGSDESLILHRIDIAYDWGWAPDYVNAMWLMLQQTEADDYVIATGQAKKLPDCITMEFIAVNLDWEDYVRKDMSFDRPTDITKGYPNPAKARQH